MFFTQSISKRDGTTVTLEAADPLQKGHCRFGRLQQLLARLQQALKSRSQQEIYTVRDEIERAVGQLPRRQDAVGARMWKYS